MRDESFAVRHSRPGLLSMANKGPHTATSQWFVTLNPATMLDGKHVAFGRLLRGMPLLRRLEALGTDEATERPTARVEVVDCGELAGADAVALTRLETGGDADGDGAGGQALHMGGEALVEAAARGDAATARALLEAGVPVDAYGSRALVGRPWLIP